MTKVYEDTDSISVTDLKNMKVGTVIDSSTGDWYAVKTNHDTWSFDDRIDKMEFSSYSLAKNIDGTSFVVNE